ncbi:MAG: hypothetical protein QOF81_3220 [Acidimicrobiaceae bacterium]|nr:hypothetical protein [Acidimicrobiaceae bacterium]
MTELNAEPARRAVVEHTRRLAESAVAAGPDVAVPTTPEWTGPPGMAGGSKPTRSLAQILGPARSRSDGLVDAELLDVDAARLGDP